MRRTIRVLPLILLGISAGIFPLSGQGRLLKNAVIHTGRDRVIEVGALVFQGQKLEYVGPLSELPSEYAGYSAQDLEGHHVYPGFILPDTYVGLREIGAVRASADDRETGRYNPNVRSLTSFNTDSELLPTFRFNGILTVQVAPRGGVISGTSSIMLPDRRNWEEAVFQADDGIYLNWPRKKLPPRWWLGETERRPNEQYASICLELENLFRQAQSYGRQGQGRKPNLKLAAMQGLLDGGKRLFIRVNEAAEMVKSIDLAKKYGVAKIVVVGGRDALEAKDFLKENEIPVLLDNTHRLPAHDHDDVSESYRMPFLLREAGIITGLTYNGGAMPSGRNLAFAAGTAAAYGLGKEKALGLITYQNAKILGIEDRVGSLEKGKDATFFVSLGDALDMRGNQIAIAFIQGERVIIEGKQQELYRHYKTLYQK